MKQKIVTCAIIEDNGKYLITQRKKEQHNPLRWEFPGGTIEFGEDPRKCLEREIKEELDLEVRAKEIIEVSSFTYENKTHIILLAFHCEVLKGKIKKKEINDYRWVSVDEIKNFDLAEADRPFIDKLREYEELKKGISHFFSKR